ncbi:galactose-specific lectin nattectin-like [Corythoichthys intestinalis]|uniref:galactose-specific lectin nattectin-like n=1 Tax=Corythoichthys intestinalis TaxID=161448 RepID=UPI0025A5C008|nr:galactose-specific lectin nattectin-like [Corythoichthys intestinalis]
MAVALRSLFLLCGLTGLLTGVGSFPSKMFKDMSCPEGWTQLDCKCYIYQSEARDFADAEAVCQILGGNMVSITSDLENAVVQELSDADTSVWIGLYDNIEDGTYFWTDGTNNDYDNFGDSQPDSTSGNCVEMETESGTWLTEDCTNEYPYVCIKDAGH